MATLKWEPSAVKSYFRLTSQKLGQIQAKLDSQGNITRKDIATLLQQGNVGLARAKAEKVIQEDTYGDLLELLELELGTLIEHFSELDENVVPIPVVVEATSSVIYAAPYVHFKEFDIVRNTLIQRFGSDFARSAITNRENYVSPRVIRAVATPNPSAALLDMYLQNVAHSYSVNWVRKPRRQEIVNLLSEILNPVASPEIDLDLLRELCSHGLPDEPSWLRPRIWKLFLGVLPANQTLWKTEISKQRACYYDLVRRLLEPFSSLPAAKGSSSSLDETLLNAFRQLSRMPKQLFSHLEEAPEVFPQNPLSANVDDKIKIASAFLLDSRLKHLFAVDGDEPDTNAAPEIRLEAEDEITPEISVSNFDSAANSVSETLLESRAYNFGNAHPQHCSAILRMLFIHASIHPGNISPNSPSFLIPLYTALQSEVEPEELAHTEADTFWLFEAMVAEFSDLEEDYGEQKWMDKFNDRLALADAELFEDLQSKGLQPALPHYSYRWLAPVLTHTIPIPVINLIWDGLFSRPPRARDDNPKLEFLVDVATAMLIGVKRDLLRLGQSQTQNNNLWVDENRISVPPQQKIMTGDAFLDGISLLQAYPHNDVGSIERILQTALDLLSQREMVINAISNDMTFGARLKATVWKGITNSMDSPEASPERSDAASNAGKERPEINDTNAPKPTGSSRSEMGYLSSDDRRTTSNAGIWGYAEKLKDSDTVAKLAKASTNWRAMALLGSWGRNSPQQVTTGQTRSTSESVAPRRLSPRLPFGSDDRRDPFTRNDNPGFHSLPSKTSYRPNRDSSASYSSSSSSFSPTSPEGTGGNESVVSKTRSLLSLTKSPPATSKSGPKPLLLNSSVPITSKSDGHLRSGSTTFSTADMEEWADVMKVKKRYLHRDSQSSISSLSPSDALKSSRTDWESDTGTSSRIVRLNRRSVSPMAPNYRIGRNRPGSRSSSIASEPFSPSILSTAISPNRKPISSAPAHMTATTLPFQLSSSIQMSPSPIFPAPSTDINTFLQQADSDNSPHEIHFSNKTFVKKTDSSPATEATVPPMRIARVRSKRFPQRPANLQIRDSAHKSRTTLEQKTPSPANANLTVEWPTDELEVISTPRATNFKLSERDIVSPRAISPRSRRPRKVSSDNKDRIRKSSTDRQEIWVSTGPRPRKVSTEKREISQSYRDNAADEGDDEGYDELLSAYESEEGAQQLP